jgi:hypothetical protein
MRNLAQTVSKLLDLCFKVDFKKFGPYFTALDQSGRGRHGGENIGLGVRRFAFFAVL